MTNYGYIYKFTVIPNNKIYIGKHKYSGTELDINYWGSGSIWKSVLKKYGKENIKREIIVWCTTIDELNIAEIYWIEKLDARNPKIGYNIALGGEGVILFGELNGVYGKHHTEETKHKMSASHPISYSENFGRKISNSLKDHEVTKETRNKLSIANKGQTPWNKDLTNCYTQETIAIMSKKAKERGITKEQHEKMIKTIISHKYHWYNNGVEAKKFRENQQPEGWVLGRKVCYKRCK